MPIEFEFLVDGVHELAEASASLYVQISPIMTGDVSPAPFEAFASSEFLSDPTEYGYAFQAFDGSGNEPISKVPILTSNTSHSSIVTVSASSTYDGSVAAWCAFDRDSYSSWQPSSITNSWLQAAFVSAFVLKSYSVHSNRYAASDTTDRVKNTPKSWTIEGSNDGFVTSTVLDTKTAEVNWLPLERRFYNISNTQAFKQYRFKPTSVQSGASFGFCWVQMGLYDQPSSRHTGWKTEGVEAEPYLAIDLGTQQRVTAYIVQAAKEHGGYPKTWELEGSNDKTSWNTVHHQSSTLEDWYMPDHIKSFVPSLSGEYRYYRLRVLTYSSAAHTYNSVAACPAKIQELTLFSDQNNTFSATISARGDMFGDFNPEVYAFNSDLTTAHELLAIASVPEFSAAIDTAHSLESHIRLPVPIFSHTLNTATSIEGSFVAPSVTVIDAISGLDAAYSIGAAYNANIDAVASLSADFYNIASFSATVDTEHALIAATSQGKSYDFMVESVVLLESVVHVSSLLSFVTYTSHELSADYIPAFEYHFSTGTIHELITEFMVNPVAATSSVWAVNLSSGGHSRYTNYNFNSFVRHQGRYLAASASGLFELSGATDAGVNIDAYVETGDIEPSTSQTYMHDIFIEGRSNDVLNVTVTTDQNQQPDPYTTVMGKMDNSSSMRRCKTGKGIKGRRWRFKIANEAGSPMELIKIEPKFIRSQRHA